MSKFNFNISVVLLAFICENNPFFLLSFLSIMNLMDVFLETKKINQHE